MNKNIRGFAAVELAIVIGFFALVLSVVMFYLNPIERAKQKHDERLSRDSRKVLNALSSFYAAHGRVPWSASIDTKDLSPALSWKPLRAPEIGICQDEACQKAGELITAGFLSQDYKAQDSVLGRNGVVYVGKTGGPQNSAWACFVPTSKKFRKETGKLFRISLDKPFPASGTLNSCPSNLTWDEEDVCYTCVAK
ncbi:MAG: hypothetical protein HYW33_01990 [Candidatus Blackburnbacteria bacterium]|nr:hypothetical protein [Candidatus Blackburnbacteria bacterium]